MADSTMASSPSRMARARRRNWTATTARRVSGPPSTPPTGGRAGVSSVRAAASSSVTFGVGLTFPFPLGRLSTVSTAGSLIPSPRGERWPPAYPPPWSAPRPPHGRGCAAGTPSPGSWPSAPRTPPRSAHPSPSVPPAGSAGRRGRGRRPPGAGAGAGSGAAWACCWAAACLLAMWPPTTAAVPTTAVVRTAARAIGRLLIMSSLLSWNGSDCGGSADSAGSINSCGMRAPSSSTPPESRTASAKGAAHRSSQMSRAADELGSSRSAAYSMSSGLMRPPTSPSRPAKAGERVEVVDLEADDRAVDVLADEDEVEDPDGPRLDQGDQLGGDLAVELVAGESHDDVFDWSCRHVLLVLTFRLVSGYGIRLIDVLIRSG